MLKRFGHLLLLLCELLCLVCQNRIRFLQRLGRCRRCLLSIRGFVGCLSKLPASCRRFCLRTLLSSLRRRQGCRRLCACLLSRLKCELCGLRSQLFLLSK